MKISHILIVINIVGLALSSLWWYTTRDYEPIITGLGLIGILIVLIFVGEKQKRKKSIKMNQKSGDSSTNIQVGRNFHSK
jgi:hypothetical protein